MIARRWIGWIALGIAFFALLTSSDAARSEDQTALITIAMTDCSGSGSKPKEIGHITLSIGTFGKKEMAKQGRLNLAGKEYAVYLPGAKSYSVKNTAETEVRLMNNSSVIYIDQNGDGQLTPDEAWNANQPIRIGDQMFDIVELATDGGKIVLRASKSPLGGVVINRKCPPFSFKTADGQSVTLDTFVGKILLLDVWSVT